MLTFEDSFTLLLYFGGMVGILFLAYYSRNSQNQQEISVELPAEQTPLPPLPPTVTPNPPVQESPPNTSLPEEEPEDVLEEPRETNTNANTNANTNTNTNTNANTNGNANTNTNTNTNANTNTNTNANNNPAVVYRGVITQFGSEQDLLEMEEETKKDQ